MSDDVRMLNNLADNLNMLMSRARVNSSELARLTGLPATTIKRIRNNEHANPTIATLFPIANYFSVSLNALLGGELQEGLQFNTQSKSLNAIPLLSWHECTIERSVENKINTSTLAECRISKSGFALIVEDRDLDIFPINSILIIDPEISPSSGDYVIVAKNEEGAASIKKYIVETNTAYLKSLISGLGIVQLSAEYRLLGVIVQCRIELKKIKEKT